MRFGDCLVYGMKCMSSENGIDMDSKNEIIFKNHSINKKSNAPQERDNKLDIF
jgi:hypothetical protein